MRSSIHFLVINILMLATLSVSHAQSFAKLDALTTTLINRSHNPHLQIKIEPQANYKIGVTVYDLELFEEMLEYMAQGHGSFHQHLVNLNVERLTFVFQPGQFTTLRFKAGSASLPWPDSPLAEYLSAPRAHLIEIGPDDPPEAIYWAMAMDFLAQVASPRHDDWFYRSLEAIGFRNLPQTMRHFVIGKPQFTSWLQLITITGHRLSPTAGEEKGWMVRVPLRREGDNAAFAFKIAALFESFLASETETQERWWESLEFYRQAAASLKFLGDREFTVPNNESQSATDATSFLRQSIRATDTYPDEVAELLAKGLAAGWDFDCQIFAKQ